MAKDLDKTITCKNQVLDYPFLKTIILIPKKRRLIHKITFFDGIIANFQMTDLV